LAVFCEECDLKPYGFFEVLNVVDDVDVKSYDVYELMIFMMTC